MAVTINAKGTSIDQFQVGKGSDGQLKAGQVIFSQVPKVEPIEPGSLYWDAADSAKTLTVVMEGGQVRQQIGEEIFYRIKASAPITNGQVVMFTGTVGGSNTLLGAPATGLTPATASHVMGIATEDIATFSDGVYLTL
jgi:hypothetical protein